MVKTSVEGRPLNESELVGRARDGDLQAYAQLVREHQQVGLRVAYVVLGDRTEAEDVTQDAFVKAYRALGRFRMESPFRPWLLRIVRNEALNRRRRWGRQERLAVLVANQEATGDAAPSPEASLLVEEDRRLVLEAVERLPARFRDVIVHRYLLDLSEAETAATLGLPAGTVKSRTARGLARLRTLLEEGANG